MNVDLYLRWFHFFFFNLKTITKVSLGTLTMTVWRAVGVLHGWEGGGSARVSIRGYHATAPQNILVQSFAKDSTICIYNFLKFIHLGSGGTRNSNVGEFWGWNSWGGAETHLYKVHIMGYFIRGLWNTSYLTPSFIGKPNFNLSIFEILHEIQYYNKTLSPYNQGRTFTIFKSDVDWFWDRLAVT